MSILSASCIAVTIILFSGIRRFFGNTRDTHGMPQPNEKKKRIYFLVKPVNLVVCK